MSKEALLQILQQAEAAVAFARAFIESNKPNFRQWILEEMPQYQRPAKHGRTRRPANHPNALTRQSFIDNACGIVDKKLGFSMQHQHPDFTGYAGGMQYQLAQKLLNMLPSHTLAEMKREGINSDGFWQRENEVSPFLKKLVREQVEALVAEKEITVSINDAGKQHYEIKNAPKAPDADHRTAVLSSRTHGWEIE